MAGCRTRAQSRASLLSDWSRKNQGGPKKNKEKQLKSGMPGNYKHQLTGSAGRRKSLGSLARPRGRWGGGGTLPRASGLFWFS